MKTIDGTNYLSITEVSKILDRQTQTIKNWYKWFHGYATDTESVTLPDFRTDLDLKRTYYFKSDDVQRLQKFKELIHYGMMSDYTRTKWGKRGQK